MGEAYPRGSQYSSRGFRFAVVVLFGVLAVTLTAAIPAIYLAATLATRSARSAVADACAAELRAAKAQQQELLLTAQELRGRYDLAALVVHPGAGADQSPPATRERLYRNVDGDRIEIVFRPESLSAPAGTLRSVTALMVVASLASVALMLINMALLRPASGEKEEAAPGQAADHGLIRTFATSIESLRTQATELERLRDQEKVRADELASVTATLVRSLTSGFISIDENGFVVDVNAPARELLGIPPSTAGVRRKVLDVLGPSRFGTTLHEAVENQVSLQRVEIEEEDGRAIFGLTTVPLLDERGHHLGMLALFTDLGPIRKLETRVRALQSLADLGELSGGIAHEVRNSLSTVLGYLRLASKSDLPAEVMERILRAEKEARQLNEAVESFLAYGRPMRLQSTPVELRALLEETAERMQLLAPEVEMVVEGAAATVAGDAALLQRVFENLIRNSIDAIREKGSAGRIDIRIRAGQGPSVIVEDNGIGLDPANSSRLFIPLQSNKANGSGLGLALARKIVLLHGGTIRLEGKPGRGAVATIEFPAESHEVAEAARLAAARAI